MARPCGASRWATRGAPRSPGQDRGLDPESEARSDRPSCAPRSPVLQPRDMSRDLAPFFAPRSIAVVGAGERASSSGGAIMQMLGRAAYGGRVVPVNPRGGEIFGYPAVTSIAAIDPPVDLAVIVIRPDAILDAARECADRGISNLLILPGGFAEAGSP